ncbi:ATP-dependent DNA helicase PIF1-like [Juglans microcarpa x Juglans regia]|uniref:ATP-dependent DNA helicase PIF1-like n=1 Tax=Juglans microcarpa x Juglans regia TaxID=2249226 RepID=UPI001B7E1540|nr:ATP-dependent DNA helicase PIF1-like [Juglans microcarpa x Juglans regia]
MGKDINIFHLLDHDISFDEYELQSREINDELAIIISEEDLIASTVLNDEHQYAYDSILQKVFSNQAGSFFIDGSGGTQKTFLYKALLATLRSKQLIAVATISSDVAASILSGGGTTHLRFKILLNFDKNNTCNVSKQSGLARLLRVAKLIIWDETLMSKKQSVGALDIMLRDINNSELLFGGNIIVFCGDFRQILPVVRKSTRRTI